MPADPELPDQIWGFGSWLLWLVATRATGLVDQMYETGPARPSPDYGMAEGHHVPTPAVVAWLLTAAQAGAAQAGAPVAGLGQLDAQQLRRHRSRSQTVSSAIAGQSRLFRETWLRDLARLCAFSAGELDFLIRSRSDEGHPVDKAALRAAITATLNRPAADGAAGREPAAAVVVGDIPQSPPAFVTRQTLARLAEAAGQGGVTVVCAVTGLRGAGKTQLAAAYARDRAAAGCGLVGWVTAESPGALLDGLARIAAVLQLIDPRTDSLEAARRLREHLETRSADALLVLDNAASPDALRPFLPATGRTQVVITSTDQAFAALGATVEVPVFSRPESLRYLAERTGLADDAGAAAVAAAVGDLPLALAQAAATIHRRRLTYASYLARLRQAPVAAVLGRVTGGGYPHATAAALLLSVQATEDSDPSGLAGRLLRTVAVLSPDGVSRDLLAGLAAPGGADGAGRTGGAGWQASERVDAAIERCVAGSLLAWSVTGDAVIMHRLLARVLRERDQAADGQWPATVRAALDLLEAGQFPAGQAWARRDEGAALTAHVEALREAAEAAEAAGGWPAELSLRLRLLGMRSWAAGQLLAAADYRRAVAAGRQLLADRERLQGAGHPDTLRAQDILATACTLLGRLEEAIALHRQTLTGREKTLGPDHPDTLASANGLAEAYWSAGRPAEAIALHRRTLAGRERVLGPDHPDTLLSRGDLASAYFSAGRTGEAIALFRGTLAGYERVLGADHPDTLLARNNLAAAYALSGRLDEAIPLHEQTLADRERVLGRDHPDTMYSRNNLAHSYLGTGRLDQAIELFELNLADRTRILGARHPDTLLSRDNVGVALARAGRTGEAITVHEQVLAVRLVILPPDHPSIWQSREHLADAYAGAGRTGEAIALLEQVLAVRVRTLSPGHDDIRRARQKLDHVRELADPRPGPSGERRD